MIDKEERKYHQTMHRLYRVVRAVVGPDPDEVRAAFNKQVKRLELRVPPWPEEIEEAA